MTARITGAGRWVCEQCGKRFHREKSGARPIRFCELGCYHAWRAANGVTIGQFKPGHVTWNKGVTGLRPSPGTEFKLGLTPSNKLPVGSITIRARRRDKLPRAFVKVAEPNGWKERAIVVWEQAHGPVPKGLVIHHKDRDSLNDALTNLEALTRSEHAREHAKDRYGLAGSSVGEAA